MNYIFLILLFLLSCNNFGEKSIEINGAWIREVPVSSDITALYFEVKNHGSKDDTIISIITPLSDKAEIHNTVISSGGSATMERLGEVKVPSGDSIKFTPGGMHVMLIGLNEKIESGDEFEVNINFRNSGNKIVKAKVKGLNENIDSHKDH